MDDVMRTVRDYVVNQYVEDSDEQEVTPATRLISGNVVNLSSMDTLRRFLERTYAIHIPDEDFTSEQFDTVERIAALVRSKRSAA